MKKIFLFSLCVILVSCQSDLNYIESADLYEKNYLVFNSIEELNSKLELLGNQHDDMLEQIEEAQGFISFYRRSEEIYDLLRNMKYESQEAIFRAFEKYSKYVEIIDTDGELEAEAKLSESMYKYVINEDRIVQVGDTLYKIFDKSIVTTNSYNYQALLLINELDVQKLPGNSDFKVYQKNMLFEKKNTGHPVSHGAVDKSAKQNKRRVKLEIKLYWGGIQLWREHRIAAQKRILGIWFNYNTDITTEIKWRFDYYGSGYGPWQTKSEKYTYDEVYEDVILWGRAVYFESNDEDDFHFRGYDCTATTDDITNSADLEFYKSAIGTISPDDTYYFN